MQTVSPPPFSPEKLAELEAEQAKNRRILACAARHVRAVLYLTGELPPGEAASLWELVRTVRTDGPNAATAAKTLVQLRETGEWPVSVPKT